MSNWREEPIEDDDALEGDGAADPERSAERAELSVGVQGALLKLSVDDRAVLALRHFSELSYREISEVLTIDEKTVKSRLFEARLRMRELLREYH